jgi:peptide subunit release factor 1 (eRF1)
MSELGAEIRRLARLPDSPYPFLSIFLDTRWNDEQQRERVRLFVRNRLRQGRMLYANGSEAAQSFQADVERIQDYVEQLARQAVDVTAGGVALFACHGGGHFTKLTSPVPFDNQVVIRMQPYLLPLVRLSDEYEHALLCMVNSRSARVLDVVLGGLAGESQIDSEETPKRHSQGGWSQTRYQRRVEDRIDHYHREVAEVLTRLADQHPEAHVFLGGPEAVVSGFREQLPRRIRRRVADVLSLDLGADERVVLRELLRGLEEIEREKEETLVRETLEAGLAGGLGAIGLHEALDAVNRDAVRVLILLRGFGAKGWRCASCGALGVETRLGCPYCESQLATCDLGARMVEKVLAAGGGVESVERSERLAEVGGVAAALRFR